MQHLQTLSQVDQYREVTAAIYGRRSVRTYEPERLTPETINRLLGAAVRAPTALCAQPWRFVIVQDRHVLKRLSDIAKPLFLEEVRGRQTDEPMIGQGYPDTDENANASTLFSSPDYNIFYDASTLIVIYGAPGGPFVSADCWLAAENLMLTATALKLGSCVIGSAVAALNLPEVKAELGVSPQLNAVAPIIVGVPRGTHPIIARNEPEVVAWK